MTYDLAETSTAEGRPYFLYLFAEGDHVWRFTSRAAAWTSPAGAIADEAEDLIWDPSAVSHGSVVQSSDPRRVDLSVTFPLSDPFARRYLGPRGRAVTTLTIFRGHEQVPTEVVAHWKGRVVSARVEGRRITLRCESLFTSMRREGVRAKYQRLCRHALYSRGCRLDIESFFVGGTASGHQGLTITVPEVALLPDLEGAIDDAESLALVEIAPGCDLRRDTCKAKFGNLLNFGGFPDIPGRNPFGGTSIV
jgi:hypothetical protein